jgi:murein DD-endopeptidase MepM/ murein hydrolase activator NlpD
MAMLAPGGPALSPNWTPRRPPVLLAYGHELRDPSHWPAEPPSPPGPVDLARFGDAVAAVCHRAGTGALGEAIARAAGEAGVDPFLLGALVFEQSACDKRLWGRSGFGLLRLHPQMYLGPGRPPLPVPRADLQADRLRDPAHSLRVGALLLRMWQDQHAEVDARFPSAPHRTFVSHFVWGDEVVSSAAEDRILTARRRLLERYAGLPPAARATALGISVVSPLEGTPRVATSGLGEDRDGGARRHRGLDIAGVVGEPVRCVADGQVTFAGLDLPGPASHLELGPRSSGAWANRPSGRGGLFVCVEHSPEVTTCYFHLRRFAVRKEQRVRAGEVIGEVGLSGVRSSLPHLHFELHVDERAENPVPMLADLIIPPRETVAYRNAVAAHRARKLRRLATVESARGTFGPDGAAPPENLRLASPRRHWRARARAGLPRVDS